MHCSAGSLFFELAIAVEQNHDLLSELEDEALDEEESDVFESDDFDSGVLDSDDLDSDDLLECEPPVLLCFLA